MMKKILLSTTIFFACILNCYSQNWIWAKGAYSMPGVAENIGQSVCTDAYGNVIVTGYFNNSNIIFDSVQLTNPGLVNLFIAKYDSSGNVLWAKSALSFWVDGNSVSTDKEGNIYVTGNCLDDTLTFDSLTVGAPGFDNVFIAKFDPNGNILWAKLAGAPTGSSDAVGSSICTDRYGNVLLTGWFGNPSISFDSITLNTSAGYSYNVFIVKYDSNGNVFGQKAVQEQRILPLVYPSVPIYTAMYSSQDIFSSL